MMHRDSLKIADFGFSKCKKNVKLFILEFTGESSANSNS